MQKINTMPRNLRNESPSQGIFLADFLPPPSTDEGAKRSLESPPPWPAVASLFLLTKRPHRNSEWLRHIRCAGRRFVWNPTAFGVCRGAGAPGRRGWASWSSRGWLLLITLPWGSGNRPGTRQAGWEMKVDLRLRRLFAVFLRAVLPIDE